MTAAKGPSKLIGLSLWVLSVVITVASAGYQRRTGPTYALDGTAAIGGQTIDWSLGRSHGGDGDQPVRLTAQF